MGRHPVFLAAATIALTIAITWTGEGAARADGAFPDSQTVLLPAEHPERIILAANFGLVFSEDDGGTWQYACETAATLNGRLYSLGAAPDERLFALSDRGVPSSADLGCIWTLGAGPFEGGLVLDYFADPVDAGRVWLVAEAPGPGGRLPAALFESQDGGVTYGPALYVAPAGGGISGVEIARSDPAIGYLTVFEIGASDGLVHPTLLRSVDRGATFQAIDLEPMLGASRVSIAAVDPVDANRIFLRVGGTNEQMRSVDSIAVSTDGGQTFTRPVNLTGGTLTAFLARRNGTVLVSGLLGATVVGYRSLDGGATFASWQSGLHPRGFGERGTTLFVATNDAVDGFALGSSEDNGDTFVPRMRFHDIQAVKACVYQACLLDCQNQMSIGLFEPAVCRNGATPDAGSDGGDRVTKSTGCGGCSLSNLGGAGDGGLAIVTAAAALVLMRRRDRRRRSHRPGNRPGNRQGQLGSLLPLLLVAVAAASVMISRPASAYVRAKTASGAPTRWPSACISLAVHLGGLPGVSDAEMRAAALAAARVWTSAGQSCTGLAIALTFLDGPGAPVDNDGANMIGTRSEGWCQAAGDAATPDAGPATCNSPSASAATSVFTAADGRIVGADTELNTLNFLWGALDDQGQPADRQDLQSVLVHEIGHVIGLEHSCWSGIGPHATDDGGDPVPDCYGGVPQVLQDTMFPTIDPGDISKRVLSAEAARAVCEIYPAPSGTAATPACPAQAAGGGGCSIAPTSVSDLLSCAISAGTLLLTAYARRRRRRRDCGYEGWRPRVPLLLGVWG